MASKKEQEDNPLNRMKMDEAESRGYTLKPGLEVSLPLIPDISKDAPLPQGFKTADNMTELDDLKFEMGRLRELLVSWLDRRQINGVWYQVLVDPMNRNIEISIEK
jgi:hypothetical protein